MKTTLNPVLFLLLLCGVFGVDADEVKTVSVMEGESVTLNTDLTEIQGINDILWKFEDNGPVIAKTDGTKTSYPYFTERFRGRLQLDQQTGSLTIKYTRINDTGLYKLEIFHNSRTLRTTFSVTVSEPGLSSGAKAGIVVGVLLLVFAVAAAGVFYYRRIVNSPNHLLVVEGEPVTLYPDAEIQKDDLVVWMFGDEENLIAQMTRKTRETHEGTDGRFRDRLKLDKRTGSLTIKSTRTEHSGLYKLQINSKRGTTSKRFKVAIN